MLLTVGLPLRIGMTDSGLVSVAADGGTAVKIESRPSSLEWVTGFRGVGFEVGGTFVGRFDGVCFLFGF